MDVSKKLELNVELKVKPDAKHIHFFSEYKNPTRKIKGGAMFAPMALSMATKALTSKAGQSMAKGALQFASKQAMSQIPGGSGMNPSKLAGMAGGMDLSKLAGMASGIAGQFLGPKKSEVEVDEEPPCETCDGSPMFYAFGKYSSFLSDSILGRKDSLDHILINMIHEIASIKDNPIGKKIIEILKNIECRSNLRQVIQDQIDSLDSKESNDKLSVAIKSYMEKSKNAMTQLKLVTNALTSKPRVIVTPNAKELTKPDKADKLNETKITQPRAITKAKELTKPKSETKKQKL
jgi:hypothetical protein